VRDREGGADNVGGVDVRSTSSGGGARDGSVGGRPTGALDVDNLSIVDSRGGGGGGTLPGAMGACRLGSLGGAGAVGAGREMTDDAGRGGGDIADRPATVWEGTGGAGVALEGGAGAL
jgi:hypothetical protein